LKKIVNRLSTLLVLVVLVSWLISCGGSSGGGDTANPFGENTVTFEGTLSSAAATARVLAPGEGGIADVQVGVLGASTQTDQDGNFTLYVDGTTFTGGAAEFSFSGQGIETAVVLEEIPGGPGAVSNVDFVVEESGDISGEVSDTAGNILYSTPGGGALGCTVTEDFVDGPLGALWKPHSEGTGTVVILMAAEYQQANVEVFNNVNEVVDGPLIRSCCEHNAGREHVYLTRTAESLAGAGTPLTVRFQFPDGFTDCRTVPDPTQRYD
jgi:hypothetical protein